VASGTLFRCRPTVRRRTSGSVFGSAFQSLKCELSQVAQRFGNAVLQSADGGSACRLATRFSSARQLYSSGECIDQ